MISNDCSMAALIQPCPWCKKTGTFILMPDDETWCPRVACRNWECKVKPEALYQAIRKTSKKSRSITQEKIYQAISHWNSHNPLPAYEMTIINLSAISHWFKK